MKLVEYKILGFFQVRIGEVLKEGSKFIFVRERNVGVPRVIKLSIKGNEVRYLFRWNNSFDRVKGVPR